MSKKKDIIYLKAQVNQLRSENIKIRDEIKQKLTIPITEHSEITVKEAICALLRFLTLEIDYIESNAHFEIRPIEQKKEKN